MFEENSTYEELAARWRMLRTSHGLRVREVACVGAARTLLLVEFGPTQAPVVTITAGVHGDEPAGPAALLSIVSDGLLDTRLAYRIWPCTNPTGFDLRTRENAEGDDINRSFSRGGGTPEARALLTANRDREFALAIDLHEDYESRGFYLYEPADAPHPNGRAVVDAVRFAGFAIESFDQPLDLGYPADPLEAARLRTLEPGRVAFDTKAEQRYYDGWPLALAFLRKGVPSTITLETPRSVAWEQRIAMHRLAVSELLTRVASRLPVGTMSPA